MGSYHKFTEGPCRQPRGPVKLQVRELRHKSTWDEPAIEFKIQNLRTTLTEKEVLELMHYLLDHMNSV